MLSRLVLKIIEFRRKTHKSYRFFYDLRTENDTIFALASSIQPVKGSPLAVIRVSGSRTEDVVSRLTGGNQVERDEKHRRKIKKTSNIKVILPRVATLTKLVQPNPRELIDVSLLLWFPKPNSYTGEDVCEFHLHGSRAIVRTMLDTLGSMEGLRPAEPGEFTRRALKRGKMSLIQAESLPSLIAAQTDNQRRLALKGLDGSTRVKYEQWIESLVAILAHLEASIDFGEDELIGEEAVVNECVRKLKNLSNEFEQFIRIGTKAKDIVETGVRVAILGKPNAGKSTFMNILCQREKSIVSDLSGTTRDVVEHSFEFGGHFMTLCDTAGLKYLTHPSKESSKASNFNEVTLLEQHDTIEREGIKRALEVARKADVILYLIDGKDLVGYDSEIDAIASELTEIMGTLIERSESKSVHLVVNKIDLNDNLADNGICEEIEQKLNARIASNVFENISVSSSLISCATKKNLDNLTSRLSERLDNIMAPDADEHAGKNTPRASKLDYVNERHLSLLKSTQRHLRRASELNLATVDEMAQHVRESVDYLSRIVGSVTNEQVIDVIFKEFCIGK